MLIKKNFYRLHAGIYGYLTELEEYHLYIAKTTVVLMLIPLETP